MLLKHVEGTSWLVVGCWLFCANNDGKHQVHTKEQRSEQTNEVRKTEAIKDQRQPSNNGSQQVSALVETLAQSAMSLDI